MIGRAKRSPWTWPLLVLIAILALVMVGTILALLTGCAPGGNMDEPVAVDDRNGDVEERHVLLNDGRSITCIVYDSYQEGGISCDWNPSDTLGP